MPIACSSAISRRRRATASDCVAYTRNAPVKSATSASAVRFERYASDRRTASSLASPGVVRRTPGGSSARSASCTATGSAPGSRRRSTRSSRPSRSSRHCAVAMSSMPSGWRYSPAGSNPATRNCTVSSATCTSKASPTARSKACAAAGLSHTESSASRPLPCEAVAPAAASPGCSRAARNGSSPTSFSVRSRPGSRACASTMGLATATPGTAASFGYSASSKPSPGACTERSAMPNRLREASCTSSAATRLIRYTEKPSATPSAIATIARIVRPGAWRSGPSAAASSSARRAPNVMAGASTLRPPAAQRGRSCSPVRVSS